MSETKTYGFEDSFEESLLARLLRNKDFYFKYQGLVEENYLESQIRREILVILKAYYLKYKDEISRDILTNEIMVFLKPRLDKLSTLEGGPELLKQDYTDALDSLYSLDISAGEEYTIDKIVAFAKKQKFWGFLINTADELRTSKKELDLTKVSKEVSEIHQIGNTLDLGYDYFAEVVERTTSSYHSERLYVPTGIKKLDSALGGGLAATEFGLILGPPSRGKTASLVNIAVGALLHRKNVVYLGLEGSKEDVAMRFDMRLSRISKDTIERDFQIVQDRVLYFSSLSKKKLLLKMFPTESVSVAELDEFLTFTELTSGFVADLIIIDYLNLCKRATKEEIWTGRNYREGKALAGRRNRPVWSAVQANMGSLKKENIGPHDIAEAPGRIWADADVIVGLCQNDEEFSKNPMLMRWKLGKNRNRDSRVSINIEFDSEHMVMEEIK